MIQNISLGAFAHALPFLIVAALASINSDLLDGAIIVIYFGYGIALLVHAKRGSNELALARISNAADAWRTLFVTGILLIASACVDIFVIVDFMRNDGSSVPFVLSVITAGILLIISLAGQRARESLVEDEADEQVSTLGEAVQADEDIAKKVDKLFETAAIHQDMDLNLRRISRKLKVPDRQVSNAINRVKGMTVSRYVNQHRIEDAQRLLRDTDQSILEISMAAGFMSKSNFNREFVRIVNQTPSQWRG